MRERLGEADRTRVCVARETQAFTEHRRWFVAMCQPAAVFDSGGMSGFLALMTAHRARIVNRRPQITFVTSEGRPLKAFGRAAGDAVVKLLDEASIALHTGVVASIPAHGVVTFAGKEVRADRIVTLPKIAGPAVKGIAAGSRWFVPMNEWCVVQATEGRVFAAGDATDFPVKHGGIAAQQADTAAAGIAHLAGLAERPAPLRTVIRGTLLTGTRPLYVAARVIDGLGWQSEIYEHPPWPSDEKIVAEELGSYIRTLSGPPVTGRSRDPVARSSGTSRDCQ